MANLNRIILVGRLTNDPEVRFTVEGVQVAKFQIVVDRFAQENVQKQVDNIDIVAWRRLAEVCGQYLKRGNPVLVEGRIQVRSFENENGVRKWTTEVIARSIKMLGSDLKEGTTTSSAPQSQKEKVPDDVPGLEELPEEESDLPF